MNLLRSRTQTERPSGSGAKIRVQYTAVVIILLVACAAYASYIMATAAAAVNKERRELSKMEDMYKNQPVPENIFQPGDINLLEKLRSNRILWSRTYSAMVRALPKGFAITSFSYKDGELTAGGKGIGIRKPLLQTQNYLTRLSNDPFYSSVFYSTRLQSLVFSDNNTVFSFEFHSLYKE
jgi:hypothetical protein